MEARSSILFQTWSPDRLRYAFVAFVSWLSTCAARSAQRRALAELDDDRLWDIGVSRGQAAAEAGKPFWRR
jgi:uncharacterized protein YjiS (DUF1127 family)